MNDLARNDVARRGLCLVLAAPSGAGKSTISRQLIDAEPGLTLSVSVTTRAPRPGEQEGVHYYFRSPEDFARMVRAGDLLEHADKFGRCYGTPAAPVEAALAAGRDVLFDIDWQGYQQVRAAIPDDVLGIFILPPSMAALAGRLRDRGGDDPAEIARRMAKAADEISHWPEFDHVVVNDDLAGAVADVRAILRAARLATARQTGLADFIAGLLEQPGEA